MLGNKRFGLLLAALLLLGLVLVACQPQTVETVREVVVTRVVTETEVVEGETVEVTRVVTEQVEVVVTPEPEEMAPMGPDRYHDVRLSDLWRSGYPGPGPGL